MAREGAPSSAESEPAVASADPNVLESVEIVVRLLEGLAASDNPLGVSELARALDESKARVHRNLVSLKHFGIIEQDVSSDKYRLGWRLYQLGQRAGILFDIRRLVDPYLYKLRDLTGLSAVLSVASGGEALVVSAVDTNRPVCITVKPGNRPSSHAAAQGRVALAWADEADRDRLLALPLDTPTPQSLSTPGQVRERLAAIKDRLWEDASNEILVGVNFVACPILREGEELVGILGIVGSVQDLPSPPTADVLRLLQGAAADLSDKLGGRSYKTKGISVAPELSLEGNGSSS
jgi:DNA-binding IclR family transcriptional regulator